MTSCQRQDLQTLGIEIPAKLEASGLAWNMQGLTLRLRNFPRGSAGVPEAADIDRTVCVAQNIAAQVSNVLGVHCDSLGVLVATVRCGRSTRT